MKIDEIIVKDRIRKDTGGIRRCYIDAKNKSRMGEPYYETTVRDYEDVMKYIESWVPECSYDGYTGTKAYIKYLNEMRNA